MRTLLPSQGDFCATAFIALIRHDEPRPVGQGKAQAKGLTMTLYLRFMKAYVMFIVV